MKGIQALLTILTVTTVLNEVVISPSYAQETSEETTVNLTKVSCRELLKMSGDERGLTLVFFHGLISAKKNQMVVDRIKLREATDKITDYCIDNPNAILMAAFEKYR
ncbi:MAG TPA: hypothetical protein DCF68_16620 [Cyanothece sp. UBA12306]|nr:hypothetical protein [Cyanothece sp. UBA12306]